MLSRILVTVAQATRKHLLNGSLAAALTIPIVVCTAAASDAHDGRFPTLAAVINHYNEFMRLGLSATERYQLEMYLKSL